MIHTASRGSQQQSGLSTSTTPESIFLYEQRDAMSQNFHHPRIVDPDERLQPDRTLGNRGLADERLARMDHDGVISSAAFPFTVVNSWPFQVMSHSNVVEGPEYREYPDPFGTVHVI